LIIDALTWHWIFFVNLPIGILGIFMVIRYVPAIKPEGKQRFDFPGAITLFLCLLAFLSALTLGQNIGFIELRVLILLIISVTFLAAFIYVEKHTIQPMIDLSLFRNRLFSINLITGFITFFAIAGALILMPFYLENVLGYSTREVGLLIAAVPVSMGVIAPLAGWMSDHFGTRPITVIGLAILLLGYGVLSTLNVMTSTIGYILRFLPIGVGMGVFQSPNNSAIMGEAPRDRLGTVSGMLAVNRTLGQTTGIAVLGALWASQALMYAAPSSLENATNAPTTAQVSALQDTFTAISVIILVALGLAVWALVKERQKHKSTRLDAKLTYPD
jgi:MFS family permease